MSKINSILEELRSDNSRLFKEGVLRREVGNLPLMAVLSAALDPYRQFYIRKIPEYTPTPEMCRPHSLEGAMQHLSALSEREKTGNAGIEHLRMILSSLTEGDAKVIEHIIAKDLKCGVSEATVNKIWPGLIPTFPCMLASGFEEKLVDKIFKKSGKAIVQLKSDGLRCAAIIQGGKVSYRSRNGKPIDILGELDADLISMVGNDTNWVVDGEMLVVDENGNILPRKTANGILNKANKGTISKEEASRVIMKVWDIIPYMNFQEGLWEVSYSTRLEILSDYIEAAKPQKISLIESQVVESLEHARQIFNEYIARKEEGTILKDPLGPWEDKRSKGLIKFKAELECDLRVVSIDEGTGKYAGMIGALQCESEDRLVKVGVGTGLTDEDRNRDPSYFLNKIVSIKYNEIITNNKGEKSLFLPVYIEIRFDKDIADYL